MKPLDWFKSLSKPVQILMILGVVVAVVVASVGALVGTAVVGTFLMPIGEPIDSTAPQVQFSFSSADDGATIAHVGGDSVQAGRLQVTVAGETRGTWASHDDSLDRTNDVVEGASITLTDVSSGDAIELVWSPPEGDPMAVARFSVP